MLYSIKLYIGITTSISLALSIYVLFISLVKSVIGAQFLNTTFLLALSAGAGGATRATVMQHCNHINLTLTLKF